MASRSDGSLQDVTVEESDPTERSFQNDSKAAPPEPSSGEEYSPKPEMNPGFRIGADKQRYFSSDLLTVRPYPLTILEGPDLPEPVPDDWGGQKIVLTVWISDAGEVSSVKTEFTDMPVKIHEATVAAFQRMRFAPAEIDGKRVGSIIKIEITYKDFRLPVQ